MEIYQLRTFIAVARQANLTRAADQLHLTQSAVSKQLRALEEELGVLLFDRLPSGTVLTASGKMLLPQAELTLANAVALKNHASALRGGVSATVRLGTIVDPESIRLGPFLGALLQYYPQVQVKLQHGISGGILEKLVSGEIDAGFYLGMVQESGIAHFHLETVVYEVIAPVEWAPRIENASWDIIGKMPWVGTPKHSSQNRLVREMLAEHGHQPHFSIEADQEASMINLVSNGVGLCLMRAGLSRAAAARGEVSVWNGVQRPCPLSFIYPSAATGDPATQAMLRVLREVWNI
jgi:DNA-binding transcriptional LysR family regulator